MTPPARRRTRRHGLWCLAALVASTGAWAAAPPTDGDEVVTLTVLATNDLHNQLDVPERSRVGGAAYLAGHLSLVRSRRPHALYVDAGDMTGSGEGVARRFGDEPTIEAMNLMGLDVVAAGNHEFDGGIDHLRRLYGGGCRDDDCDYRHDAPYEGASFATLSANVVDTVTGSPVLPAWTLREVEGVQVGIVGLTTSGPSDLRQVLEPRRDVDAHSIHETVNPAVEEVVAAGADVVVVVWHEGSSQKVWGSNDPNRCQGMWGPTWNLRDHLHDEVDVVVDGHTHQAYVCDVPGGPLMTQAGHSATMFTEITLAYDRESDRVVERAAINRRVTHDVAPDPDVAALIEHYQALVSANAPPTADLDGDRLGDAYETFRSFTDPRTVDTDGDGLDDGSEVRYHHTRPRRADSDGGGVADGAEVDAGTSPLVFLDDRIPAATGSMWPSQGAWTLPAAG